MTLALSWTNHVDAAGVGFAAGSQVASLPAANLADPVVARPWQTSASVDSHVEIDFGAGRPVQVLALAGLQAMAATDTIRARLSNVAAGAGELLDTGVAAGGVRDGYAIWSYVLAEPVEARWLRFDIAAPSLAAQGFFRVGRAWAGPAFRPQHDFRFGAEIGWRTGSRLSRASRSGTAYADNRFRRRYVRLALDALAEAEALDDLLEMQRLAGLTGQVLLVPRPASPRAGVEALVGYCRELPPIVRRLPGAWSVALDVEEAL